MLDGIRKAGTSPQSLLASASAGAQSPFPTDVVMAARERFEAAVAEVPWDNGDSGRRHSIEFRLLGRLLKAIQDPDWSVCRSCEVGVPIGVGVSLPRTPAVFAEKTRWSLPGQREVDLSDSDDDWSRPALPGATVPNYGSTAEHMR